MVREAVGYLILTPFAWWQPREALFEEEGFSLTDERTVLLDYSLVLDEQADVGATARMAEHGEPAASEYPQEVAAGDDDSARGAGVRKNLYDQGPIFGELPPRTVLQVRHRNGSCLRIEISIGAPP